LKTETDDQTPIVIRPTVHKQVMPISSSIRKSDIQRLNGDRWRPNFDGSYLKMGIVRRRCSHQHIDRLLAYIAVI
jgi:hypothetical protein